MVKKSVLVKIRKFTNIGMGMLFELKKKYGYVINSTESVLVSVRISSRQIGLALLHSIIGTLEERFFKTPRGGWQKHPGGGSFYRGNPRFSAFSDPLWFSYRLFLWFSGESESWRNWQKNVTGSKIGNPPPHNFTQFLLTFEEFQI